MDIVNNKELQNSIDISREYFDYIGEKIEVVAKQDNTVGYSICKEGNQYIVHYNSKSDFFNAIGTLEVGINKSIIPYFSKMGIMIDCARNGVPNIKWLKRFIITIAFSGYNYLGLYFEDCLEVEGEKLFGYMRGRFTQEEIKEIVAFADNFGVEIVPYIQTLAHLQRLFNHWYPYVDEMKDVFDIIMVDEPRTYTMIENVIKTCSKCFSSRRIHIGMDEAPLMLLGNYRNKHGNVDRAEVFSRHVRKVCDICQKYGFEPSAWADMFEHYGVNGKLELPPNLTLSSWSYYLKSSKEYKEKFALSEKLTNKISFASGAWTWVGYAPLNEYTLCT